MNTFLALLLDFNNILFENTAPQAILLSRIHAIRHIVRIIASSMARLQLITMQPAKQTTVSKALDTMNVHMPAMVS